MEGLNKEPQGAYTMLFGQGDIEQSESQPPIWCFYSLVTTQGWQMPFSNSSYIHTFHSFHFTSCALLEAFQL